jgi:hypothetical protein
MSIHSEYQDLMVDVLFGEASPEETQKLEAHLDACDACADEFASMQATLQITAERERPEPPEAYWDSYRYRLEQRAAHEAQTHESQPRSPSALDRLRRWWQSLPAVLPQTAPQWALQGAVAVGVLLVGLWMGGGAGATGPGTSSAPLALDDASARRGLSDLMLASQPVRSELGTARPSIAGVRDITYDVRDGTVEIRYNTVTDVVVRGRPGDPQVQRLLQAALLDERNPASRLHAVKALEAASVRPDEQTVQALRYLAREETDPDMRLRAVRALRSLYANRPMDATTKNLLVGILLNAEAPALRIEAMEALTTARPADGSASDGGQSFLYQVRNDSNRYLRYRAETLLQQAGASTPTLQPLGTD